MINVSKIVTSEIVSEAKQREDEHISSGKLSASGLGDPVQWQVLKWLGVKSAETDNYTYCKFQRGRDVEEAVFNRIKKQYPDATSQEKAEYKDVVGLIDIYIPSKNAVIEIKSTANSAFRYLVKENKPKENHALQGCLYALAKGLDTFSIVYVATDDYRCLQFECKVSDYSDKLEEAIEKFNRAIKAKKIPVFRAKMKWQEIAKYNKYPEWSKKTKEELVVDAKRLYK